MSSPRRLAVMVGLLLAVLSAGTEAGHAQGNVAGTYCLRGVREVGSCFRFSPDQTFEYELAYGAYDEGSMGRWRLEGNDIVLTSPPYDRKPRFVFKESRAAGGAEYKVRVVTAEGRGIAGVNVRITCDGGAQEGLTQEAGYETPCTGEPREVALGVRMIGLPDQPVAMSRAAGDGRELVFVFEPGDLGKKPFVGVRLQRSGGGLRLLYRNPAIPELDGKTFTYQRN